MILSEAVLSRPVGGAQIIARQLGHLLDLSKQGNVVIRVLPFSIGVHGGMAAIGSFTVFDFPTAGLREEPIEPPLAYIETLTGAMYLNKVDEVAAYRLAWADMEARALDENASRTMIADIREGYWSG